MVTKHQSGFALLLTIVIIGVVLSIGLSLLDITVKQLSLSSTGRDSVMSFYGANAGIECAQFYRNKMNVALNIPTNDQTFDCFGANITMVHSFDSTAKTHVYTGEQTWNNGYQDLCSKMFLYIIDSSDKSDHTYTFTNKGLKSKLCEAGNICTVVIADGYNRACTELDSLRTVQRELTVEY